MALSGLKTLKVVGSFFLLIFASMAFWKEVKLSLQTCEELSQPSPHFQKDPSVKGDSVLVRRPIRNSPGDVLGAPAQRGNYMLRKSQGSERTYERYEDSNITVFATSPPSSGLTAIIELIFALNVHQKVRVVPLVDGKIIATGKLRPITDYINTALQRVQPPAVVHTYSFHVDIVGNYTKRPLLISIVRDPIERAVSLYYYARANNSKQDSEQVKKWRQSLNIIREESFDDCVRLKRAECVSANAGSRLIRHFCGYDRKCKVKNRWTLERAKKNIEDHYFIIGTRPEAEMFVEVLERRIPSIFKGGRKMLHQLVDKGKLGKTDRFAKVMPSEETVMKLRKNFELDLELYEWINERFGEAQRSVGLKV